jgi:glycosyltransferase involved in cell wall biosynthesis
VDDPDVLLVHVTPFNDLMWDSGRTPTRVIDHGVVTPAEVHYTGELERGLAVVNGLAGRGRRCGADLLERARQQVPLDLVGMDSTRLGGLGEIRHDQLPAFAARYRFFFHPIRYTSMGLAVCEAMMLGVPVVGLATTEMAMAVENGVSGYVDTSLERLISRMRHLLANPAEARRLGEGARRRALQRFQIDRFIRDWDQTFHSVVAAKLATRARASDSLLGERTV